jgi:hypothetical protein
MKIMLWTEQQLKKTHRKVTAPCADSSEICLWCAADPLLAWFGVGAPCVLYGTSEAHQPAKRKSAEFEPRSANFNPCRIFRRHCLNESHVSRA